MPGILSGRAVVEAESSQLCGADVAFRKAICCDGRGRLDALVGYRFLSFDDAVRVFEDLHPTVAPFPPDSRIGVADGFAATNRFHGLLLGLGGEYRLDGWFVAGRLAASVGRTFRTATVAGQTSFTIPPEAPLALPGGLLALSSNSGRVSTSDWTVVPEAAVRVGCEVTDRLRVYAGYSALYWPNVYRAAGRRPGGQSRACSRRRWFPSSARPGPCSRAARAGCGASSSRSGWKSGTDGRPNL